MVQGVSLQRCSQMQQPYGNGGSFMGAESGGWGVGRTTKEDVENRKYGMHYSFGLICLNDVVGMYITHMDGQTRGRCGSETSSVVNESCLVSESRPHPEL